VLHDMFAVPFEEIADMLDRSPTAARQLASRARRRVRNAQAPDDSPTHQRRVVDAFFSAVRDGDFAALLAVLDPDVVLRSDGGRLRPNDSRIVRGAESVARGASRFSMLAPFARPARVDGNPGAVVMHRDAPYSIMSFTVARGRITAIDILVDPERLGELDLSAFAE
jgi:RNA polymerase sigma-70 factor (ECF subfamily)